jgi:ATP-dependent protease ClpP protease subunit
MNRSVYFKYVTQYENKKILDLFLFDFGEQHEYAEAMSEILTLKATDEIRIHLNSTGGIIDSGIMLINTLKIINNPIQLFVESTASSMAANFACYFITHGYKVHIYENVFFMFHDYSTEFEGKGSDLGKEVSNSTKYYKELDQNYCCGFLTPTELKRINKGETLYVKNKEILKRIEAIINENKG